MAGTSSDTDELMVILLAMATGAIAAEDTSSDSQVKVTMKRVINGETDYLYVNRVFTDMHIEGREREAWPSLEVCYWLRTILRCVSSSWSTSCLGVTSCQALEEWTSPSCGRFP